MKLSIRIAAVAFIIGIYGCQENHSPSILVFSKTEGFRHKSIEEGTKVIKQIGADNAINVDATENADYFTTNNLKKYDAVIFLNTTGDILNPSQQLEFQRYIQAGGGYVGIHAASDTEYEWPWYVVTKTDNKHSSTDHLPERWTRTDEWYNYKSISEDITPLLMLDESSYEGGTNDDYHPIAWYHEYDGGRSYYTGGGHTEESFHENDFIVHLTEGIKWAMGGATLDYHKPTVIPEENRFVKEELDSYFNEPMELDLLPDGRIIFIERKGAVKMYDPASKKTTEIAKVDVYSGQEDGLMGLAVDPNFSESGHVFLCYSNPEQTVSRVLILILLRMKF